MPGPWERYAQPTAQAGPWTRYQSAGQPEAPAEAPATESAQPRSTLSQLGHDVGRAAALTARTGANLVAGIPLMAADFGMAVRDVAENVVAGRPTFQKNREYASEMFQRGMSDIGVPEHETAVEKVSDFAGQVLLGSRLPVPGVRNPAPTAAPSPRVPSRAETVIAEGEKHGVPVFYDDVTNSAVARRLGTAAENLGSLGTGAGRAAQEKAAGAAAGRVVQSLAPSTGDDVPELVQKGLQTKLGQFRESARRLYDRVGQELDPVGDMPRPGFDSTLTAAKQEQAKLGTLANDAVVSLVEKYQKAPTGNFTLMRNMRSQLADEISDFYTGRNTAIGAKGVTILRQMQEALEKDMASFAQASGTRGYNAWRMADGFYRANLVPFKEQGFRDLVKTAEPEKAWRYLLAQGGVRSRAERMYRSLDDQGRGAVRYGLVKDALDNATTPRETFSPAKFAKYLEDNENAVSTFFKGSELQEIRGFQNLMRHVERAGQFAENPPTGQRVIPFLIGGAAMVEPGTAATVAAAGTGVRALFQTRSGRNLLLAMSRAKEGSPAATRIAQRAVARITAGSTIAASGSTATDQEEKTPR